MTDNPEITIHLPQLMEVIARVSELTTTAAENGMRVDDIMRTHFENMGVCFDGLNEALELYVRTILGDPIIALATAVAPEPMLEAMFARGLSVGLILGRENPR
jgi:hypothetical protein